MTERDTFVQTLNQGAAALDVELDDEMCAVLWRHFEVLCEVNAQFNLTRITEPAAAAAKLYADSLAPLAWARQADVRVQRCVDVGTGAGFPAVPLAVAAPRWRITAIDSTGKKTRFVTDAAARVGLKNVRAEQQRAGQWRPREPFDLAVFKAVGRLDKCVTAARDLLRRDGHAVIFKGPGLTHEELEQGQLAAEAAGMQTWDTVEYDLPAGDETLNHSLVIYRRV